jgi:hypothetical protein
MCYLLILTEEFEVDLDTLRARWCVCVCVVFSEWFWTDIPHVTYWRRREVVHTFAALLYAKISSMRPRNKETENTQ